MVVVFFLITTMAGEEIAPRIYYYNSTQCVFVARELSMQSGNPPIRAYCIPGTLETE